jgi:hypothetical protein
VKSLEMNKADNKISRQVISVKMFETRENREKQPGLTIDKPGRP